jgi:DNA-binding NtrC family response regulator
MKKILLVDDSTELRQELCAFLLAKGFIVTEASNGRKALDLLYSDAFDLVLLDYFMPELDGPTTLAGIMKEMPGLPVIMMSGTTDIEAISDLFWQGVSYFVPKPFVPTDLLVKMHMVLSREKPRLGNTQKSFTERRNILSKMIGESPLLEELKAKIKRYAKLEDDIRITGANGTGKELVAKAIHVLSRRTEKHFIPVNCGAISPALAAEFFFGRMKGAYTGADTDRKGIFEEAEGGTIFLDEVADLPMEIQNNLLRTLADRSITRLGSNKPISINVRIISATNKPLHQLVKSEQFREDIYQRLDALTIHVPSLNARRTDIPLLVDFFIQDFCSRNCRASLPECTDAAMQLLVQLNYRGNIRQLRNLVAKLCAECDEIIDFDTVVKVCSEDPFFDEFPTDGCAALGASASLVTDVK